MKWIVTVSLAWVLSSHSVAQQTYLYVVDVGPSRTGPHQVLRYDADGSNPHVFIDAGLSRPRRRRNRPHSRNRRNRLR